MNTCRVLGNHGPLQDVPSCHHDGVIQGTMFLKSVDASDRVKDANLLFQLLDEVITKVGVTNVVQVITDNASNYVLAGKMLESKHNHILDPMCCTLHRPHA